MLDVARTIDAKLDWLQDAAEELCVAARHLAETAAQEVSANSAYWDEVQAAEIYRAIMRADSLGRAIGAVHADLEAYVPELLNTLVRET